MPDHASSTRTRARTRLLYRPTPIRARTTTIPSTTSAVIRSSLGRPPPRAGRARLTSPDGSRTVGAPEGRILLPWPQDRRPPRGTTMRQRVLIVEDDAPARKGMADLLSLWGYEVTTASDGAEALERVAEESPAVVVSDLVMPGMDGLALLSALRVDHPDVTVIMLTGQGSIESAVQAMKEGAYDYLTKPVDPARLQILLERALDRTESAREVAPAASRAAPPGRIRPAGRRRAGDAGGHAADRAGRADRRDGARARRERDRQGAGGAHDPRPLGAPPGAVRRRQLRGDPRDPARERDLRPRAGRVHRRRPAGVPAASSWPTAARSSSTRSPR